MSRIQASGQFDKFFENLKNGNVELVYEKVNARTNGSIQVSQFPLGAKIMLGLDESGHIKILK